MLHCNIDNIVTDKCLFKLSKINKCIKNVFQVIEN